MRQTLQDARSDAALRSVLEKPLHSYQGNRMARFQQRAFAAQSAKVRARVASGGPSSAYRYNPSRPNILRARALGRARSAVMAMYDRGGPSARPISADVQFIREYGVDAYLQDVASRGGATLAEISAALEEGAVWGAALWAEQTLASYAWNAIVNDGEVVGAAMRKGWRVGANGPEVWSYLRPSTNPAGMPDSFRIANDARGWNGVGPWPATGYWGCYYGAPTYTIPGSGSLIDVWFDFEVPPASSYKPGVIVGNPKGPSQFPAGEQPAVLPIVSGSGVRWENNQYPAQEYDPDFDEFQVIDVVDEAWGPVLRPQPAVDRPSVFPERKNRSAHGVTVPRSKATSRNLYQTIKREYMVMYRSGLVDLPWSQASWKSRFELTGRHRPMSEFAKAAYRVDRQGRVHRTRDFGLQVARAHGIDESVID